VFRQQHLLNPLGMLTCRANPIDDGLFCVPFSTRQAADPAILRYQGQGVNDLIFGCAAAIEDRSFGLDEGTVARLAFVTLATCFGFAEFDDVRLVFTLQLTIIVTVWVRAEIAHSSLFWHIHTSL
jgi:hypothetical protein